MKIGEQIRKIRQIKKISLTELSEKSGVQIATLSRIENGKMTGTVESHLSIARAMGVDITELYQTLDQEEPSLPLGEEAVVPLPVSDGKCSQDILARQVSTKRMLPALIKIEAKGTCPAPNYPPTSERFLYILEGTVELHLKTQTVKLSSGMSIYFNASQPHSITNDNDKAVRLLSISTPVTL